MKVGCILAVVDRKGSRSMKTEAEPVVLLNLCPVKPQADHYSQMLLQYSHLYVTTVNLITTNQ